MMEALRLRCAVLSVAASHTVRDGAGDLLAARAQAAGHELVRRDCVADDADSVRRVLADCIADPGIQVVLSAGGAGFARRNTVCDVATALLEQEVRGFGSLLHNVFFAEVGTSLVNQRALAGYANKTLIFCLPGATGACALAWDKIISPQLAMPVL
ncbi:molybdenum cofactor biosynthesis protein [Duganella sp. FT92W]|uniref:Molybdenum cofactor biosynthesis protein B n=1 Tax=Pseudoduganella rivuli TaxID=2666085 RepID=A0A7X2LVJ9_9BURK|nr:molybdopterin-binding protein [Pseudoduganella rivuli]MRV73994.1 molybdenum cofactor biosynthesis protein [Pseudoduganella rivuli]